MSGRYGETGLITLAVVVSLLELGVVLDGVGMAVQPLLGTYLGEHNSVMIRRLMNGAKLAATLEGIVASALVLLFARQFCGLFGIKGGAALEPTVRAVRIVSLGLVCCSMVSLMTSYYMLIDRIGLAVGVTFLKDGVLYAVLPLLGSMLFGMDGMWAAFAVAPVLALILASAFIRWHYGKERFPSLLAPGQADIVVFDSALAPDKCSALSRQVQDALLRRGYPEAQASKAALFTEEICLTIIGRTGMPSAS